MIEPKSIFGRLGNQMFQYAYIYSQMKRGDIPDIYIQNNMYFDEYKDDILQLFGGGIGYPLDMVGIHIRRAGNPLNTDEPKYSLNPFYVNLMNTPYYTDAMSLFRKDNFIVFSDDIKWCKTQPIFEGCEFSEGRTELEDMNLLASCKGIITANSSFSWWSAYLSNAKVIAPKRWYSDGVERTFCPKEWIRI